MRSGGIVICSPTAPVASVPVFEEGWSNVRDDDYTHVSTGVPARKLTEEEQLDLALKASMDRTLEERVAQAASLLFYDASGNYLIP